MSFITTIDNGNPDNRIDIVILGDGYRSTEFDTMDDHVASLTDYLFTSGGALTDPFGRYAKFFNVHVVHTASAQSGTDDPVNSITKNTAFDTTFLYDGVTDRLLSGSVSKADAASDSAFSGSGIDPEMFFMTVNTTKYGGAGGPWATFAGGNSDALELALHELGHSFADLADEYGGDTGVYPLGEPTEANVSKDDTGGKWDQWVGYDQPGIGIIGAYEGGRYYDQGIYRPSDDSKMRNLDNPFDVVSIEQFILKFYSIVDPLDSWTSNAGTVTGKKKLVVKPIDNDVIDVKWKVDGENAGVGDVTKLNLTKLGLAPGTITSIKAIASDPTDMVRINLSELKMTVNWTVKIPNYVNMVSGTAGKDILKGVAWKDSITGKGGNDKLFGYGGSDKLFGGLGGDKLFGGGGKDKLFGNKGNDILTGSDGRDILTGGAGADVFNFSGNVGNGIDRIKDFELGVDQIRFGNGMDFGDLTITSNPNGAKVTWDDGALTVDGVTPGALDAGDFIFLS